MKHPDDQLFTPLYVRREAGMPWPDGERAFHVLGKNGLFLCRNHPFFRSCVPAPAWPSELAEQDTFLELHYPKIPRRRMEAVVGFFARVAELHGSEAGVLLAWDAVHERLRLIVPEQRATVGRNWWGDVYPIGLHYEAPKDLPPGWTIIGDIHSHADEAAYASATDRDDEQHRPGLHIVVGKISREPPDFHVAAVVDGTRFRVEPGAVIGGYVKRRPHFPQAWLERVRVEQVGKSYSSRGSPTWGSAWTRTSDGGGSGVGGGT